MIVNRLRYEIQSAFGMTALLPLPALAGLIFLEAYMYRGQSLTAGEIGSIVVRDTALLLPICSAVACAALMSIDREENYAELRATYQRPLWQDALVRTIISLLIVVILLATVWIAVPLSFHTTSGLLHTFSALPATLYLLGLTMLINHLSGNYWAAAGTALSYWLIEVISYGKLTGPLYLFNTFRPVADAPVNFFWLAGLGTLFLALNILLGEYRRRAKHLSV